VRLETLDDAGHAVVTGKTRVEADGSFFVKTPADKPIRFALLDKNGAYFVRHGCSGFAVENSASAWAAMWAGAFLRERVPDVLLRSNTPTDLSTSNNAGNPQNSRQEKTK